MEEQALITFKSTHFALMGEKVLKDKGLEFKTIPTPREVSHSCGLSLLFNLEDIKEVEMIIKEDLISIDDLYKYTKDKDKKKFERIL